MCGLSNDEDGTKVSTPWTRAKVLQYIDSTSQPEDRRTVRLTLFFSSDAKSVRTQAQLHHFHTAWRDYYQLARRFSEGNRLTRSESIFFSSCHTNC